MKTTRETSHTLGRSAERAAEQYLSAQGLKLVTRNFRGHQGEIDLIMDDGGILVFVEVRNRRSSRFGNAIETINAKKQAKLIKTAQLFLTTDSPRTKKSPNSNLNRICRFDTVDFDGEISDQNLRWIKNAFSA